jgi:hypothetical protein
VTGPSPGKQTLVEQINVPPVQQRAKGLRDEAAVERRLAARDEAGPHGAASHAKDAHSAREARPGGSPGAFGIARCIGLGSRTYTDGNMEVTVSASANTKLTLRPSVEVDRGAFRAKPHVRNIIDSAVTINFDEHGHSVDLEMFSIKQGHLKMHEGVSARGGHEADAFLTLSCVIPAGGHEAGLPGHHGHVEIDGEVSFDHLFDQIEGSAASQADPDPRHGAGVAEGAVQGGPRCGGGTEARRPRDPRRRGRGARRLHCIRHVRGRPDLLVREEPPGHVVLDHALSE